MLALLLERLDDAFFLEAAQCSPDVFFTASDGVGDLSGR